MFLNLTNHSSINWSEKQKKEALEYGEIVNLQFPNIPPTATRTEVEHLANIYLDKVDNLEPDCVLVQGEFSFTYALVSLLKDRGYWVVTACTERKVVEKQLEDGTTSKTSVFDFVQFRAY